MKYIDTAQVLLIGSCNGSFIGYAYLNALFTSDCLLEQWTLAFLGAVLKA